MTLPTGAISLSQVAVELGRAANAPISLLETAVRNLAGIASGPVDMYSLRGKSAYTLMQASGVNDNNRPAISSSNNGGTATATPSVDVSFGSGGYSFLWTIVSSTNSPTLSNATSQTCNVSKVYSKGSTGSFDATLQCVIQDNTGHSITVTGVLAAREWGTAI